MTDTNIDKGIVIIERFQRGGLVAYSVDEGKTYHPTVDKALIDLQERLAALQGQGEKE